MKKSYLLAKGAQADNPLKSKNLPPMIFGFLLFLSLGMAVNWFLFEYRQERNAELTAATLAQTENMRQRLESELNTVIFLSNGFAVNWKALHNSSSADVTLKLIQGLLRQNRHVRSVALSEDYRVAYVDPPDNIAQVIGSNYKNEPLLWPLLQRGIETGNPFLEWQNPIPKGLVYWVPLFEDGQFIGLLSTLIDDTSLFTAAGLILTSGEYQYALRVQGGKGPSDGVILGPASLFGDSKAQVSSIAIPGGVWELAVKAVAEPLPKIWPLIFRAVGWLFAALFAVLSVTVWSLNQKLAEMALYDRLTGLPSRHLFLDRLKQMIRRTKRKQGQFSILFIKLIQFSSVNEAYGLKIGEILLTGIGKRINAFIRNCDTVTRWEDGEKFLVLLDDCPKDQAAILIENLRHQIELPIHCGEHKLAIGASLGLATFPQDGHSLTALLKVAEAKVEKGENP